jgi:uncharacterized protein (TIGR02001 family)
MKDKTMKQLSQTIVMATAMTTAMAMVPSAQAEVSASASIASEYLWRGQNLSVDSGAPAFSGSLDYAHDSGLYAGIWMSSGDSTYGTETDLYAGFSNEVAGIGYDIGYATYLYSETAADEFDDVAEFYLGLSYDIAGVRFYKSSDSGMNGDYLYTVLSLDLDPVAVAVGNVSGSEGISFTTDYTHLDLTYAFNDNLAFTYSKIVDQDIEFKEGGYDKSGRFVVSYSLPVDL